MEGGDERTSSVDVGGLEFHSYWCVSGELGKSTILVSMGPEVGVKKGGRVGEELDDGRREWASPSPKVGCLCGSIISLSQ